MIPSYSLGTSLYTDASIEFISQVRNSTQGEGVDISADPWDWNNNQMDFVIQFAHFFFWFFVLFLIEADLGKRCRRCYKGMFAYCFNPKPIADLKIDPDVSNEAKRVAETPNE